MLKTNNPERDSKIYSGLALASAASGIPAILGSLYFGNEAIGHYKRVAEVPTGMVLTGNPLINQNMYKRKMAIETGLAITLPLISILATLGFRKAVRKHKRLSLEQQVQ